MSPGTGRLLHAAGYRVIFMECRGLGDSCATRLRQFQLPTAAHHARRLSRSDPLT